MWFLGLRVRRPDVPIGDCEEPIARVALCDDGGGPVVGDSLLAGRQAFERGSWEEAREALTAADREAELGPDDLRLLADASWWVGHPEETVAALERAHSGYLEAGEKPAAAFVAVQLGYLAFRRLSAAVGSGWLGKAEELLDGVPETFAHAWLALLQMAGSMLVQGDVESALAHGERALDLARRLGVPEVEALAQSFKGYALVTRGDWKAGLALIDRATTAAVSGRIDLRSACDVYCNTIACCRDLGDYRRATEWTEEADRWMHDHSVGGYTGVCSVHRAELKRLRGSYAEAEQEARAASKELERYHLLDGVGMAHNEIGQVRLHRGDLEGAEQAFMQAYEYGHDALPGLALLRLASGKADEAMSLLEAPLSRGEPDGANRLWRARLLPALVTVAVAAGNHERAERAARELEGVAEDVERPALQAAALAARGEIMEAEGDHSGAVERFERAWRLWQENDMPYESARARMLLGRARRSGGQDATARMDLLAARSAFERIGAVRDMREAEELLGGEDTVRRRDPDRVVRTFMFTDIVTSTDLAGLLGDEAWGSVLSWHDRALRDEFGRFGGREVRHTGDGFFVVFENPSDAVEAAVAIQRRLADHRRREGFAPWVRVGVHTAEAIPEGGDFSGQGVHVAARVGDLGGKDDIVVSSATLEAIGRVRFPTVDRRAEDLKGVSDPVEVSNVEWRS